MRTGLHVVADLKGADTGKVFQEAAARGVEVAPLAEYFFGRTKPVNGLALGFAAVPPEAMSERMERLAAAIEAASRSIRDPA